MPPAAAASSSKANPEPGPASPKADPVPEPAAAGDSGHHHIGGIEAEDASDAYDSAFSGATNSSTTSVSSSVFEYQYENGRRYQVYREGYTLPNDEAEQDRLDLYHHIFRLLVGGRLHIAPLENPQRILDIGTGTGAWAIDMADENEQAEVLGNDLSPIQPTWVPPNVRFEVDDVEQPWAHKKDSFDFIHMRTLSGCFKDWPGVIGQCFEHIRPGGYLEFQDYGAELMHNSGTLPNSSINKWWTDVSRCAASIGRPYNVAKHVKGWMEEAGFVEVTVQNEIWPLGPWPKDPKLKERGRWGQLGLIDSLEAFSLALLTRIGGWSTEEVKMLCVKARQDLLAKDNRYYIEAWFVYGKKPEEGAAKEEK